MPSVAAHKTHGPAVEYATPIVSPAPARAKLFEISSSDW